VRWLLGDGRALKQEYCGDAVWLRVLDVPGALSARGYATPGRLVLEVVDDSLGGYAAGRYLLDAAEDGATCTRTTESPDLRLSQHTLASAYLGDHSLRALAVGGGIDEFTAGAVTRADAMLATPTRPWNATGF
jgi:predicted acetyltransferase